MGCSNGGQPKEGVPTDIWMDVLDIVASAPGIPANVKAVIAALSLPAIQISIGALCSAGPPEIPQPDWSTLLFFGLLDWAQAYARNQLFYQYCDCKPPLGEGSGPCQVTISYTYGLWPGAGQISFNPGPFSFQVEVPSRSYTIEIRDRDTPSGEGGCPQVPYQDFWAVGPTEFIVAPSPTCFRVQINGTTYDCANDDQTPDPPPPPVGVPDGDLNLPAPPPIGDGGGGLLPPPGGSPEDEDPDPEAEPSCCSKLEWVEAGIFTDGTIMTVDGRKICRAWVRTTGAETAEARIGKGAYPDTLFRVGQCAFQYGSGLGSPEFIRCEQQSFIAQECGADCFAIEPDRGGLEFRVKLGLRPLPPEP